MSRRLVLAGPPGVGKTTVGALVAARLGWAFLDTDDEITRRSGLSIAELFARRGEAAFRAAEAELVHELLGREQVVIATGGGLPADPARRQALKRLGPCASLHAPLDELVRRLGPEAGSRPLLRGDVRGRLAMLLAERAVAYADLHYSVATSGRTPDEVAADLAALARSEHARLPVRHPGGSYDLVLGRGLLRWIGSALAGRGYTGPLALLTDNNVEPLYARAVLASLEAAGHRVAVAVQPAGEASKRLATVEALCDTLLAARVERGGAVLALGGGVVGDVAGLVAATYQRGVALIQLPTTLLAMADSSLGGKVGVDTQHGKNLIGAFKQPDLVLADLDCLETLPGPELVAGLAEVVKAGLIGGGAAWDAVQELGAAARPADIQAHVTPPLLQMQKEATAPGAPRSRVLDEALFQALFQSIQVKRTLVEEDPHEAGRRALLNLGHTFGHAIEAASGYAVRHGEAVAVGLVAAAELSLRRGLCGPELVSELRGLLEALGLPQSLAQLDGLPFSQETDEAAEAVRARLGRDKKRRAGRDRFVLIRAPGEVHLCDEVEEEQAAAALRAASGATVRQGAAAAACGSLAGYQPGAPIVSAQTVSAQAAGAEERT